LTPVPAITGRAKTHPQFPVPTITGRKKAREDNCLSYPLWRRFGSPIVLLLLRTNKPIIIDFLSIFLEDLRGPRKMVFHLKIMHSKSAGNHGALRVKSTNFQGLVFIPKMEKLLLWHLKWKEKHKSMFRWPQNGRSRCSQSSNLSGALSSEFWIQIADLRPLPGLKKTTMVMYSITSKLNSTFRTIG